MRYISTRGGSAVSGAQAILNGLAKDGGLYVPERFPMFSCEYGDYPTLSAQILGAYLPEFSAKFLNNAARAAYGLFSAPDVLPMRTLDKNTQLLNLYCGPTLAFKDVALTILPHLMAESANIEGVKRELIILVATSGDTGKAALSGFSGVPGVKCAVFYPENGVSVAQKLQMLTQVGDNLNVFGIRGNFDDAQRGVKRIFLNTALNERLNAHGYMLSSANSINWGRLAPQIAYYFWAYNKTKANGQRVNFVVPTGNFGNILAGQYARYMGLPIGKLILASNANNVLYDFLSTGVYDAKRALRLTTSPSMDILISSNLERLLFELSGRDGAYIADIMHQLSQNDRFAIRKDMSGALKRDFAAGWANDDAAKAEIARTHRECGEVIDPHTAVARAVLRDYRTQTGDDAPCVVIGTASPFKFGSAVAQALFADVPGDDFACCAAIEAQTGAMMPESIRKLTQLPILHNETCLPCDMDAALERRLQLFNLY